MLTRTEKISRSCILITLGMLLGYLESMFNFIPLPGVKPGLSNLVVLYALFSLDIKYTYSIGVLKSVLNGILFSGITGIFYSLTSMFVSITVMYIIKKKFSFFYCIFPQTKITSYQIRKHILFINGNFHIIQSRIPQRPRFYLICNIFTVQSNR